jgi:hypothetical protein
MKYLSEIIDAKGKKFFSAAECQLIADAINAGPGDGPCAGLANLRYFTIEHARKQLKDCALRWKEEYTRRAHALIKKIDAAQE